MRVICKRCGSTEVESVDRLIATNAGTVESDLGGTGFAFVSGGYSECHWETAETLKWRCRSCGREKKTLYALMVATR